MDIVNPNYLNYMEQIQKNRKDIENLYNQELSDITQLNFKENDENGLQYANGKAIFQGKSTIIRDENTENLEINSKVELKISSGDNDIVIDAGADNSTLNIHLDNETKLALGFAESERQKVVTDGATIHEKDLIDKSMTLIDKIYVPDESYSQLRFDNLPGNYNYKLIVIGAVNTASDGSIKINDTDLKSITLTTNSDETSVANTFGDTALIRVDKRFMVDADISVTDTYDGSPLIMEINNISSSYNDKIYGRRTSSQIGMTSAINSITIDIGTSKFYRGTQAFLYKLGDKK